LTQDFLNFRFLKHTALQTFYSAAEYSNGPSKYSGPSNSERFDVRTTRNSNKKFEENAVLKLEQKLESRTKIGLNRSKTQSLVEKWHPSIAVVNRSLNLFNDYVMQHFRKIKKKDKKQMTLDRFLSKEKSNGGNVNEPQLSTSGFQMKEG
jgi:hypothetical protein